MSAQISDTAAQDAPGDVTRLPGKIIAFCSYTGGVGRTMALANVAWILASNRRRVLAVDWDLASPGLQRYFRPYLVDQDCTTGAGVIDLVRKFVASTMDPPPADGSTQWFDDLTRIREYASSLEFPFQAPGTIDFVSAGRQDRSFPQTVGTFDWADFYTAHRGDIFLRAIREDMRSQYDYILISCAAGFNKPSDAATLLSPDVMVNGFSLSTQSIEGAWALADALRRRRGEGRMRILPVPMRVDQTEESRLETGRELARDRHEEFLGELQGDPLERYWADVEIPYEPRYAYEEIPAVFGDAARHGPPLLAAYERLTAAITQGEISALLPMPEVERRQHLADFERLQATAAANVLISYSAIDRVWAEWIAAQLTPLTARVTLHEVHEAYDPSGLDRPASVLQDLGNATRVIFLISPEYSRSPQAQIIWKVAAEVETRPRRRLLVPIRTNPSTSPPAFVDRPAGDIFGRSEADARQVLLVAVGLSGSRAQVVARSGQASVARFPGTPPTVWNLPARNTAFTGRDDLLERVRNHFVASTHAAGPLVLHGIGGVGKTQMALEYAYRFMADYDVVWWIAVAEGSRRIPGELASLGAQLGVQRGDSVNATAAKVVDALRRGIPRSRWLLIFDNVDDPNDLTPYVPRGGGHVLVTSRYPEWAGRGHAIPVNVFLRDESLALLDAMVPDVSPEDADLVADKLGDLPLAIEQAGAWLLATASGVSELIRQLDRQVSMILEHEPPSGYPQAAAAMWQLAFQRLRADRPAAGKLMQLCSFFAPQPIPTALLRSDRAVDILTSPDGGLERSDPLLVGPLVSEISRYALARVDASQGTVQVHRLVQAVIRDLIPLESWPDNRSQVHEILAGYDRGSADDPTSWGHHAMLWPHVVWSKATESSNPKVRQLVIDIVRYLGRSGDHDNSQELGDKTLAHWLNAFGVDDPLTLVLRANLANVMRQKGEYENAYFENEEIYQRQRQVLGPEHLYTLMTARSLAADHRTFGRYQEAKELDEETLTRFQQQLGDNDPQTLMTMNNLAVSYRLVGDFRRAAELDEATLQKKRAILRPRDLHPSTLRTASNYGRDLREIGDFGESRRLLEETYERCREVLGERHPDTLTAAKNLAVTLRKLGHFAAAETLTSATLRLHAQIQPAEHLDHLACSLNLALDHSALGDDRSAQARCETVLAHYKLLLGMEHTFTLACLNNLGIFLRRQGRYAQARQIATATCDQFDRVLGPTHPYSLAASLNLANDLYALAELGGALERDEATYAGFVEQLNEDHPDTLAAGINLVSSRRAAGAPAAGDDLLRVVLPAMRRVLGPDHPNTIVAEEPEHRFNCDIEPPPT